MTPVRVKSISVGMSPRRLDGLASSTASVPVIQVRRHSLSRRWVLIVDFSKPKTCVSCHSAVRWPVTYLGGPLLVATADRSTVHRINFDLCGVSVGNVMSYGFSPVSNSVLSRVCAFKFNMCVEIWAHIYIKRSGSMRTYG